MANVAALFAIVWSIMFQTSLSYPNGAPVGQCERMTPNHGSAPQTQASPFEVKVQKLYYMPGESVEVSIESPGDIFKGFLIQARKVGENTATGMFAALPANGDIQYVACGNEKGAVTHKKRLNVTMLKFEWQPPASLSGNISFFATVVRNTSTFWTMLESPELYKREITNPSVQPSTAVPEVSSTKSEPMNSKTIAPTRAMTAISSNTIVPSTPTGMTTSVAQLNRCVSFPVFISFLIAFLQNEG